MEAYTLSEDVSKKNNKQMKNRSNTDVNQKKGFFKDKGYKPTTSRDSEPDDDDSDLTKDKDTSYTLAPTKAPRPTPEPEDIEQKKRQGSKKAMKKPAASKLARKQKRLDKIRYCFIIGGIIILLLAVLISYQNFLELSSEQNSLEKDGYNLMIDLSNYDGLVTTSEQSAPTWDANKFLKVDSENIKEDLNPEVEFLVEVEDLSTFPIKYDRTLNNGQAWSSKGVVQTSEDPSEDANDKFSISMVLNIYSSPEEVHLAKVTVTVWED